MKPKTINLYLILLILATTLGIIEFIRSLLNNEDFYIGLIAIALFGYFTVKYWKNGKLIK